MSDLAPGLLVASPALGDPSFDKAVVLLAAHSEEGAFGWVINGAQLMSMGELLRHAHIEERTAQPAGVVRAGGPVGKEQVWLLYPESARVPELEEQVEVGNGIVACSSRKLLEQLGAGYAPSDILGVAGYAGWAPHQLENEIRSGAWLPMAAHPDFLFGVEPEDQWLSAYERVGVSAIAFTSRVVGSA